MSFFNMSTYLEAQVLNLILNGSNWLPPATVYLGLFNSLNELTDGSTYSEVRTGIGNGYGRPQISFNPFVNGSSTNASLFDFPVAIADWGSLSHYGIFDAPAGGNLLFWGEVQNGTPVTVLAGQQFEVPAGTLSATISGSLTAVLANKIGEHVLRNNRYTSPASVYLAVLTAFTSDLVYTELSDANYVRQSITWTTAINPISSPPAVVQNSNSVTFPGPVTGYTASHLAIFDALTSGNMLLRGPLSPTKSVIAGATFPIPSLNITASAD